MGVPTRAAPCVDMQRRRVRRFLLQVDVRQRHSPSTRPPRSGRREMELSCESALAPLKQPGRGPALSSCLRFHIQRARAAVASTENPLRDLPRGGLCVRTLGQGRQRLPQHLRRFLLGFAFSLGDAPGHGGDVFGSSTRESAADAVCAGRRPSPELRTRRTTSRSLLWISSWTLL